MEGSPSRFSGAVLCGGASRRMGTDKALLVLDGLPLAARVARELHVAGARPVLAVGGDAPALTAIGLRAVPDLHPGAGPVGGVLTALDLGHPCTVVVACDLVAPSAAAMRRVAEALATAPDADGAVPVVEGRHQWVHAAWRTSAAGPLARALGNGHRSFARAAADLRLVEVGDLDASALVDADVPADIPGSGGDR